MSSATKAVFLNRQLTNVLLLLAGSIVFYAVGEWYLSLDWPAVLSIVLPWIAIALGIYLGLRFVLAVERIAAAVEQLTEE